VQDLEAGSRIVSIGYIDAVNCFGAIPPYQLRALAVTTAERSKRAVIDRRSPKIDAIATSADGRDRTPAFETGGNARKLPAIRERSVVAQSCRRSDRGIPDRVRLRAAAMAAGMGTDSAAKGDSESGGVNVKG
jgi:hypothetical protein